MILFHGLKPVANIVDSLRESFDSSRPSRLDAAVLYLIIHKYNGGVFEMSVVTVSQKGWVVIPAELREKYQWKTGDRVKVIDYGGVVSLVPLLDDPEEEGAGSLKIPGRSLLQGLKRVRKEERRREQGRK